MGVIYEEKKKEKGRRGEYVGGKEKGWQRKERKNQPKKKKVGGKRKSYIPLFDAYVMYTIISFSKYIRKNIFYQI